nr:hypothetical protein [Streptomyces sp. col6]
MRFPPFPERALPGFQNRPKDACSTWSPRRWTTRRHHVHRRQHARPDHLRRTGRPPRRDHNHDPALSAGYPAQPDGPGTDRPLRRVVPRPPPGNGPGHRLDHLRGRPAPRPSRTDRREGGLHPQGRHQAPRRAGRGHHRLRQGPARSARPRAGHHRRRGPAREDARDALVLPLGHAPATLAGLPPGTRVGTSAPRRAALLRALYPGLVPVPIRGNADSRLARLDAGTLGVDVMLAALAGLRRLGHAERATQILDPAHWLPASGAGIVVVEHRTGDDTSAKLLAPLTHAPTRVVLDAERAALATLGGGCLTAASVHAVHTPGSETVTVHAVVLDPAGGTPVRTSASGPAGDAARTGRRAGQQLLHAGAARLLGGPA